MKSFFGSSCVETDEGEVHSSSLCTSYAAESCSHHRRPVPTSFAANNQEVTPSFCSHNCDSVCGQAKSETEMCLETRCPAPVLIAEERACCFPFGTFQSIALGLMTSPGPAQVYQSLQKDEASLAGRLLKPNVC